jgi:hypothetical protein
LKEELLQFERETKKLQEEIRNKSEKSRKVEFFD